MFYSEFHSCSMRSQVGALGAALGAWLLLPNWRLFVLWCAVPGVVAAPLVFAWVWESPSYLSSMGRVKEARQVLRHMAEVRMHAMYTGGSTYPHAVIRGADGLAGSATFITATDT